jgi:cell pole-organizing protein PopZ
MNRADQASEPSMEEILASIRLIISDDAKKAPAERDDAHAPRPAAVRADAAPADAPREEEVLDLTEELVFPEEQPAQAPATAAHPAEPAAVETVEDAPAPAAAVVEELRAEEARESSLHLTKAVDSPQEPAAAEPDHVRQETAPEPREEASYRPAQPQARPIWSRRELPGSQAPAASAGPRIPPEPSPSRQPQRSWAEDIQMPITDRGPVSLIAPGETQVRIEEPSKQAIPAAPEEDRETVAAALGEKEEAAVAALAESLARSAANAMDEEELATAGDIDFERLDRERKAGVAESFANAIKRESAPRELSPLPTLLDEVFGQDFVQESVVAETAAEVTEFKAAAEVFHKEDEAAARDNSWHFPAFDPAPEAPAIETPRQESPVAQALFVGTSKQEPLAPSGSGGALEDAVRDMLRPLLKQWLNDNMPRILENAIREEIAVRGILPKVDK